MINLYYNLNKYIQYKHVFLSRRERLRNWQTRNQRKTTSTLLRPIKANTLLLIQSI